MAKKRGGEEAEKENSERWLLTYSDMITLLLALFIVLYAMSQVDEQKYNAVAAAMSEALGTGSGGPNISLVNADGQNIAIGAGAAADSMSSDDADKMAQSMSLADLYNMLAAAMNSSGLQTGSVGMTMGSGTIRISFMNDVLFEPNSSVLTPKGEEAVKAMIQPLQYADKMIKKVEVDGHTAVGASPVNDWDLSTGRAASVTKLLIANSKIEPAKFQATGFAQYHPIDTTVASRNRRVEIIVTRNDELPQDTNVLLDVLKYDYNTVTNQVDLDNNAVQSKPAENEQLNQLINKIKDKYDIGNDPISPDTARDTQPAATAPAQVGPPVSTDINSIVNSVSEAAASAAATAEAEGGGGGH